MNTVVSDAPFVTERLQTWRRRTDAPFLVLAVASLPLLVAEMAVDDLHTTDRRFLLGFNIVVAVAFVLDLIVELTICRDRRHYLRSNWLDAAVAITQALAIAPARAGLGALRVLRAVRPAVAAIRVVALAASASRAARRMLRRRAASFALWAAAFTWLSAGMAFVIAEDGEADRDISLADGVWWALSTITTVGYGDIYPTTPVGRIIAGITMLVGISTFAVVTAKVAEYLVRPDP